MADVYFEDVEVGQELPQLRKGPISPMHVFRWSAATENLHRIHYDVPFATQHEGLPNVMVNGSWKQNVLFQLVNDWAGENGWLWKASFQFRSMNIPWETLYAWGKVHSTVDRGDYGIVEIEIGLVNQDGIESTPGTAKVVLAKRQGPLIPYPFDPSIIGE